MLKNLFKGRKRGITSRWVTTNLLLTIIILAAAAIIVVISTRQSYYNDAQTVLETRVLEMVNRIYENPQSQVEELRKYVVNFTEKEKFEVMLISEDDEVTITSSGYTYSNEEPLDDYKAAKNAANGKGSFIGKSAKGEHIIAVTQLLSSQIGETVAVRFVSSLQLVDASLVTVTQIAIAVCSVILVFSIMTGLYTVRSIVVPLGEIGHTASKIADGDFDVRIENVYNDEIGDLCAIINDMAAGLSMSDRVKNEFISSVSHELRTPLTAIKGWGETIKTVGPSDTAIAQKGIDIIINETERLSVLVEDLLDFSRLQSGNQIRFNFEIVDIVKELREAAQIFEQRANNLKIAFHYFLPDEMIQVSADKNRLRQVFSNLIDNAIKYSQPKDTVTIALSKNEKDVKISVSDMGIGIPPEDIPRVSDRFYKASNSLTGSGIGLAVVKEIVVMHDGTFHIESELGKGTTVSLKFPLLADEPSN